MCTQGDILPLAFTWKFHKHKISFHKLQSSYSGIYHSYMTGACVSAQRDHMRRMEIVESDKLHARNDMGHVEIGFPGTS